MNEAALFRGQELNYVVSGNWLGNEHRVFHSPSPSSLDILLDMHLCFGVCQSQTIRRGCTALSAGGVAVLYEVSTFVLSKV